MPVEVEIFEGTNTIFGPQQYDPDPNDQRRAVRVLEAYVPSQDLPVQTTVFGTRRNIVDAFDGQDISTLTGMPLANLPKGVRRAGYYLYVQMFISNPTGGQEVLTIDSNRPYAPNPTIKYSAIFSVQDLANSLKGTNGELTILTTDPRPGQMNILRRGVIRVK